MQILFTFTCFSFAKLFKYMHLTLYINLSIVVNCKLLDQLEKDFDDCVGFSVFLDRGNLIHQYKCKKHTPYIIKSMNEF